MKTRRMLSVLLSFLGWFAIVAQFYLMMGARTSSALETIIRFFSFFTILTNTLVAVYFTVILFPRNMLLQSVNRGGLLTALSVYITMVGLVYQVALRHIWEPEGLQLIVDELLHSVIPVLVIVCWYFYADKSSLKYSKITAWMIYPILYFLCILIRGKLSGFYPYPFINVPEIGMAKALTNAAILLFVFLVISWLFVFAGRALGKR